MAARVTNFQKLLWNGFHHSQLVDLLFFIKIISIFSKLVNNYELSFLSVNRQNKYKITSESGKKKLFLCEN